MTLNNQALSVNNNYPVEQSFKFPLIITTVFILLPSIAVYLFNSNAEMGRIEQIFFGNWISPVIVWFFSASFLHLLLKKKRLKSTLSQSNHYLQTLKQHFSHKTLTDTETEEEITTPLPEANSMELLSNRVSLYTQSSESLIDDGFQIKERELMRSSFSLTRFMVWAIPIIGFIGTVWGISNGISHFSDAMSNTTSVNDVSSMLKENLPLVTRSLSTAFDTTLLALILSVPLMMLMIWSEKNEEMYLIEVEDKWQHEIKPKLTQKNSVASDTTIHSSISTSSAQTVTTNTNSSNANSMVASEIKQLSLQVKALQETMEDHYESTFSKNK